MDKGRKVCPLDTDDISVLCCGDKCAWWDSLSGRCCIASGADAIRDVADRIDVMCDILNDMLNKTSTTDGAGEVS